MLDSLKDQEVGKQGIRGIQKFAALYADTYLEPNSKTLAFLCITLLFSSILGE
jgi:hypothetical protein